MNVCDPFLADYLKKGEIIESIDLTDEIKGVFVRAKEKALPLMNYPYRLLCYRKDEGNIWFTVNLEVSFLGTCCFGVHAEDSHLTLGSADKSMGYEEFRQKAVEIARKVIEENMLFKEINLEEIYFLDDLDNK